MNTSFWTFIAAAWVGIAVMCALIGVELYKIARAKFRQSRAGGACPATEQLIFTERNPSTDESVSLDDRDIHTSPAHDGLSGERLESDAGLARIYEGYKTGARKMSADKTG